MYTEPELDGQTYSDWAKSLGWLIVAFPIVVIPVWFLLRYCSDGGWKVNMIYYETLPLLQIQIKIHV